MNTDRVAIGYGGRLTHSVSLAAAQRSLDAAAAIFIPERRITYAQNNVYVAVRAMINGARINLGHATRRVARSEPRQRTKKPRKKEQNVMRVRAM